MNILCIAYQSNLWNVHKSHEESLIKGLMQAGARVDYFICNGANNICGMQGIIDKNICASCVVAATRNLQLLNIPYKYLYNDDKMLFRVIAEKWVKSLDDKELLDATYHSYPLGRWLYSSMLTSFRLTSYRPGLNPLHDDYFKVALFDAAFNLLLIREILDATDYQRVLLFNARLFCNKLVLELARERGIEVYIHERGVGRGELSLSKNQLVSSFLRFRDYWQIWKDIPLREDQLRAAAMNLRQREVGDTSALNWESFSPRRTEDQDFLQKVSATPEKRIWSVFTSSTDEFIDSPGYDLGEFSSQLEWLEYVIAEAGRYPNVHLVIRAHPNLAATACSPALEEEYAWYQKLHAQYRDSEAVTVIRPQDKVCSYELMDISDAGISYVSTCGLEMAAKGLRVCIGGATFFDACAFAEKIDSPRKVQAAFARWAKLPKGFRDPEVRREAFRFWHLYTCLNSLKFPQVLMPTPHVGHLRSYADSAFDPRLNPELGRITDWIISGQETFFLPAPEDLERSQAAEDEFFAAQAAKKGPDRPLRQTPQVSVILSVYNGGGRLRECVESILNQSMEEFEFIIVDDASTDQSAAILAEYKDSRIKVYRNGANLERAAARNFAVSQAEGDLIAVVNAGDVCLSNRLELQSAFMRERPEVALSGGFYTTRDGIRLYRSPLESEEIRVSLLADNSLGHSTWMLRRRVFSEFKGYREAFIPAEGYELLARMSCRKDLEFANIPDILTLRGECATLDHRRPSRNERADFVRLFLLNKLIPGFDKGMLRTHLAFIGLEPSTGVGADELAAWGEFLLRANAKTLRYDPEALQAWVDAQGWREAERLAS